MVGAVLSVVLSNQRGMRMAVSFMRTRTSFLRSSVTVYGSRLAFSGKIIFDDDEEQQAA